ncbi:hypothetical protein LOD99_14150 [Oopsacas minuta]|uniref:EGF-like domain-containing protein n=1 Tax=Oopsacas minuta TaxID=111878 RepID=A0AAV7KKQ9_9METZ|nr:hypothetical protein LOD99_14150 [Oopsacas minuta]
MNRKFYILLLVSTLLVVLGDSAVCENENVHFIRENFLVYRNNIDAVNDGLKICSKDPSYLDFITLTIQNEELTGDISLDIGDNIKYLTIDKRISQNITIMVPHILPSILRLELKSQENWFILKDEENNFFKNFPKLQYLDTENIWLPDIPSFVTHSDLTRIQAIRSIFGTGNVDVNVNVDNNFVSGLQNLIFLSWKESTIQSLSRDAFKGLSMLTELTLENNEIAIVNNNQFSDLTNLIELDLSHNKLTTVGVQSEAFVNLISLRILRMNSNPLFSPNIVFHPMFNLEEIFLQNNEYFFLDFRAFQQKSNLRIVYLIGDNMFDCECDQTGWMANVSERFNITFIGGICDTPPDYTGEDVAELTVYDYTSINCSALSYDCFGDVNCTTKQMCINTHNSFACECLGGFADLLNVVTNRTECLDINECANSIQYCDQNCKNLEGSYTCGCEAGYTLEGRRTCLDVDECTLGTDECQEDGKRNKELCVNTIGSYDCNCSSGFELRNLRNCIDRNECLVANECTQVCNNTVGDYECLCSPGFEFLTNYIMNSTNGTNTTMDISGNKGVPCVDTNECISDELNLCTQNCTNTIGSFFCSCVKGYNLTTRFDCEDIDECTNTTLCDGDKGLRCNNTLGSFECICKIGYIINVKRNTTCIPNPSLLTLEQAIGVGIAGFAMITFFIVVTLILIFCIYKYSRQRVKQKTEGRTGLLMSGISVEHSEGKQPVNIEDTGRTCTSSTVFNPYEIEGDNKEKEKEHEYETVTDVHKEETIEYGVVKLSDSIDKKLLEKEYEREEDIYLPPIEITSSDEAAKYREVQV